MRTNSCGVQSCPRTITGNSGNSCLPRIGQTPRFMRTMWEGDPRKVLSQMIDYIDRQGTGLVLIPDDDESDDDPGADDAGPRDPPTPRLPTPRPTGGRPPTPVAGRTPPSPTMPSPPEPARPAPPPLPPPAAPLLQRPTQSEKCPRCGRPLVPKEIQLANSIRQFWACSGYPNCRFTKDAR